MKEISVGNVQRQRTDATVFSGQWERTGLSGIYNVEIGYQVGGMSEFRCGDSLRFISSVMGRLGHEQFLFSFSFIF